MNKLYMYQFFDEDLSMGKYNFQYIYDTLAKIYYTNHTTWIFVIINYLKDGLISHVN